MIPIRIRLFSFHQQDWVIPHELKSRLSNGTTLLFGGDVRITPDLIERLAKNQVPTLGGSPYLLVEFPPQMIPHYTSRLMFDLRANRLIPVVTHPERYAYFVRDFSALQVLRAQGCLFQITAMSLTKDVAKQVRKVAFAMIEKGFADFVASDAHSTGHRAPLLSKAYAEVQRKLGKDLAETLFLKNPQRILESVAE